MNINGGKQEETAMDKKSKANFDGIDVMGREVARFIESAKNHAKNGHDEKIIIEQLTACLEVIRQEVDYLNRSF
jgi:hypothetical protein